jgi:thioredoxin reductase (NADPH)
MTIDPVVVIGAGPVGLFSVFACGMLGIPCYVIDTLKEAGGQCMALYPEKPIFDIPAYPAITGKNLIEQLKEQASPFKPRYFFQKEVQKLIPQKDGGFAVQLSDQESLQASAVLICTGGGQFTPKRPPLKEIEDFEGSSIFYHIADPTLFRNKRVLIAGGGDSALDWALELSTSAEVTLIHRRHQFKGQDHSQEKLQDAIAEGRIRLMVPFQLAGLKGQQGQLQTVLLVDDQEAVVEVETDYLLPFFGLDIQKSPFQNWGLEVEKGTLKIDPATGQTNIPGIYGAGDCVTYPHKLKLILTGFAEACQAAHFIKKTSGQPYKFQHSTSKGVLGF